MHLENTVWRLIGLTRSEQGILKLGNARLVFVGQKGTSFDISTAQIGEVKFPWHYLGGGMKVLIGAETYRFSFLEPHNDTASISDGRSVGAEWKAALSAIKGTPL